MIQYDKRPDAIWYNKIRYLVSQKNDITHVFYHNYVKIKVDSYGSLPLEKTSAFYFITLINTLN